MEVSEIDDSGREERRRKKHTRKGSREHIRWEEVKKEVIIIVAIQSPGRKTSRNMKNVGAK